MMLLNWKNRNKIDELTTSINIARGKDKMRFIQEKQLLNNRRLSILNAAQLGGHSDIWYNIVNLNIGRKIRDPYETRKKNY